ncbi:phage tail tube protein [Enterococcus hulanensis]|uniref:Phage tail tube protein n=1 Tax=Enterococcus hulanensis TaxID=2559929 RepID=A0ABU3EZP5_9ENTE|nr:phage tail tube protein [Enterococcus hulanensis]MDT2600354.1 phage tail tube protein [Enterococcus hulanensis]MDT2609908.1 phage tail tube protein [Enterococcus hulanensis]MDT2617464.1 phage tail tube protein [Enterococcus hulanensis]MDT2628689.1 phage tail tube protein [Enterococcus hulanensis]MDT2656029.1 phage tail tube protein [Enterococcus hulanensis]
MKKTKILPMNLQLFAGLLTKDTTLSMKAGSESTFAEIEGLQAVPEIGGDPEQVDITTLKDANKKYISGIQDMDSLEFTFLYDKAVFTKLKAVQTAGKEAEFELAYPDGAKCTFTGGVTVKMGSGEVNGAYQFTLSVTVSDGPDWA